MPHIECEKYSEDETCPKFQERGLWSCLDCEKLKIKKNFKI
jgi:hypothetical protein